MKHRWRTDLNWLSGLSASQWLRLLRTHRVHREYWHRGALLSALSVYNSLAHRIDGMVSPDTSHVRAQAPVFILGHWRSGTTWLYHLLAQDPDLAAPNAFQVTNPRSFPATEWLAARVFQGLIPTKRVQDDVALGMHTPEEDEYAIGVLSGMTPYLGRSFPERAAFYERFLTLRDCSQAERDAFGAAMHAFTGRLTAHTGKRLVLKSPAHTARVRYLLEWFPDAHFVHIHRDPYAVFQSTRHLYDTVDWFWTLQRRPASHDATILRQYEALHEAWFEDVALIPPGRLHELSYESLVDDPMGNLETLYSALDLGPFSRVRPALEQSVAARTYRPNRFEPLTSSERQTVYQAARPCFEAWDYMR